MKPELHSSGGAGGGGDAIRVYFQPADVCVSILGDYVSENELTYTPIESNPNRAPVRSLATGKLRRAKTCRTAYEKEAPRREVEFILTHQSPVWAAYVHDVAIAWHQTQRVDCVQGAVPDVGIPVPRLRVGWTHCI